MGLIEWGILIAICVIVINVIMLATIGPNRPFSKALLGFTFIVATANLVVMCLVIAGVVG